VSLDVIAAALPQGSVTLGKRCAAVESRGEVAVARFEDGAVLATALVAEPDDPVRGLERYERTRRPRASRVVLAARERGLSNHLTSPLAAVTRDIKIAIRRRVGKDSEGRGAAWIPEYDAASPDVLVA
jgi:hypothetical protein